MRLPSISFVAALLLAVPACSGADQPTDVRRQQLPTASATPRLESAERPAQLTCPTGRGPVVTLDYGGDRRFSDLLAVWTRELGRPWVDLERERIWFLRDDGSAHSVLDWTRAAEPADRPPWFVDGYESCRDSGQWKEVAAPSTPVGLTIGSCWIDPIRVGDETWDFAAEEPGSPVSRSLALRGALSPAGDVAIYTDEAGRRITLVPEGDPWAIVRGVCN